MNLGSRCKLFDNHMRAHATASRCACGEPHPGFDLAPGWWWSAEELEQARMRALNAPDNPHKRRLT